MTRRSLAILIVLLLLTACAPSSTTSPAPSPTPTPAKIVTPTDTPAPQGKTIIVDSPLDSSPGSLRVALSSAAPYDTITFDPEVFKPDDPATITLYQPLPDINIDHLTIDASNAGVILNSGLSINARYVTIQGLHIINPGGTAITLWGNAQHTTIGGDPQTGDGPLGQGNLITGSRDGILARDGSSHNTIAGNQIGVEFNGNEGITYSGIQINDHSPGNIIGPNNILANNGGTSIDITTGDTEGVNITRNLIYGEDTVLRMVPPTTNYTAAPVILSYDPAGTVSGIACPGCEVEIFSGDERWAEFYEGSVTAGPDGSFTLDTGTSFSGESLKATATTPGGSTSNFSLPTPGGNGTLTIQDGNNSLAEILMTFSSAEIQEDNRMGTHGFFPYCWMYCWENAPLLNDLGGRGIKRIRLSFNEMEVSYDLSQSEYLDENHEGCIDAFQDQDMTISYIISYWNKEAQNAGEEVPCERFTNVGPGDPETEDYLQYVRDIVGYLSEQGVHEFEIWNEPNNFACTQGILPENYIALISLVVPEIKAIDPEAKVILAGQTGTDGGFAQYYLRMLAESEEIMPIVEGLTWHPFYGPSPAYTNGASYYNNYPSFAEEIKTLAAESGFTGEFRADEMTWRGFRNADPGQPWSYEDLIMPKYYARGIMMHLGMDIVASADVDNRYPMVYYTVRNLSTVMVGNKAGDLDVEIESAADNILSYGFTMSNGDQLFSLWTNGAAVEYDPGVNATLTFIFEGEMPTSVTGIDVLHGYTQPLEFEISGDQLIIHDLRVKDYPMIIQFSYTE